MTTEELQDLSWASLPKETRDKIREMYISGNTTGFVDVFGHKNIMFEDKNIPEILSISRPDAIIIQNHNEYMFSKTPYDDLHRQGFYEGRIELMKQMFGDKITPDE